MLGKASDGPNRRLLAVCIFASGLLLVLLVVFFVQPNRSEPRSDIPTYTSTSAMAMEPSPSKRADDLARTLAWLEDGQAHELVAESDEILQAVEEQGVVNTGRFLRHELNRIEVTEDDMRLCYEEEREHFGDRSFEESIEALDRLVRYRKLREQYQHDEP